MEIVKPTENLEHLNQNIKDDFYKVPNLNFDVEKMRADLNSVLKKKKFKTLGIKNFGAISLNQIPGDKSSTEGHNVRGTYWTIPDEKGQETERDKPVDEAKYTEIVPEFKGTYFEEVYNTLKNILNLEELEFY